MVQSAVDELEELCNEKDKELSELQQASLVMREEEGAVRRELVDLRREVEEWKEMAMRLEQTVDTEASRLREETARCEQCTCPSIQWNLSAAAIGSHLLSMATGPSCTNAGQNDLHTATNPVAIVDMFHVNHCILVMCASECSNFSLYGRTGAARLSPHCVQRP